MKDHLNCILCNSPNLENIEAYSKVYLCKCLSCGLRFSRKKPSEEELEKHYNGYKRNDYLSPITIKRYNELLDEFEPFRKTNKIIDIGSGIGYFLDEAKKRDWEVYGTEFTDEAVSICANKGIKIKKGPLTSNNFEPEMFDIITSFEVIEHINNPKEELSYLYSILRKGGLVYLTTPNFNSLLRYRLKSTYNIFVFPDHLTYYTQKSLKKLFNSNGFKTYKFTCTGFSLTRLKTSNGTSNQQFVSKTSEDELIRNQVEKNRLLQITKNTINFILTITSKGDSLKAWFIKK